MLQRLQSRPYLRDQDSSPRSLGTSHSPIHPPHFGFGSFLCSQAPVHLGPTALASYFTRLNALPSLASFTAQSSSPNSSPIPSCRYLLQDSPKGFFLTENFIAGLKWLGEQGIAFDMTLDATQQEGVLEDAVDAIQKVREGQEEGKETRFILGKLRFSFSVFPFDQVRPPPS